MEKDKPVGGIKKHTPNRKCLHQKISDDGKRVTYYHVTKGWRTRLIVEPSLAAFGRAIKRAQEHKFSTRTGVKFYA